MQILGGITHMTRSRLLMIGLGLALVAILAAPASAQDGPTLESVARDLHTSSRTLRRRIKEAGSTFQTMLDELRSESATRMLKDRRLSIENTASRLGFSTTSAFYRAFKRWHGTTPATYRSEAAAAY
jgi:AraC-like DNA-binding protein